MNEEKTLAIIKKLHNDAENLFEDYIKIIDESIEEVSKRKIGLDQIPSKADKYSVAAMQKALKEVVNMRDDYVRSRERYIYVGLEELLKIVNDWFDFMNIVTSIHLKSARLMVSGNTNDRPFSLDERDQLIKLEEIISRFEQRLK